MLEYLETRPEGAEAGKRSARVGRVSPEDIEAWKRSTGVGRVKIQRVMKPRVGSETLVTTSFMSSENSQNMVLRVCL